MPPSCLSVPPRSEPLPSGTKSPGTSPGQTLRGRLGPPVLIVLLGLLFFSDLVIHPTQVLYSNYSDLFPLHLPAKRFLVRSWQETGEVPLWCPHAFAGMPFVHDLQSSAFYPPHLLLYLLPEEWVGAGLSWLIVLHVIAAGLCTYAYARYRGLGALAGLVSAAGYMFAGKWLLHVLAGGHYNMVPLAWLPLVLLWLEQALRQGSLLRATWAGAAFSLFILGAYPYVTLYAGLFTALWTLGPALERAGYLGGEGSRSGRRTARALGCWAGLGAWTALVAVALGAVQLLPGLEASGLASRAAGVAASGDDTLLGGLRSLVGLVGPPLTTDPDWIWENRVGLGLLWLGTAAIAPLLGGRRVRFEAWTCVPLFLFALGGASLLQGLPGFRFFQLHSRILLLLAFPVSLLAGSATQALFVGPVPDTALRRRSRQVWLKVTVAALVLLGVFALVLRLRGEALQFHAYWLTLLVTLPAASWLLGRESPVPRRSWQAAWLVLLLLDLWAVGRPLVAVKPEAEVFAVSRSGAYLAAHAGEHGRVLDFNPEGMSANSTPLWPGMPTVLGVEGLRGFNPVDVFRYKEYLQLITDRDEPLRPLDRMFTSPPLGTFPIRNQSLADLLGVRYLVQPSNLPLEDTVQDGQGRKSWKRVAEDPAPRTFNFTPSTPSGEDCGLKPLPLYVVYENANVLPRAFVVPEAAPMPARPALLPAMKTTDFRRTVLLENCSAAPSGGVTPSGSFHPAEVESYRPNEVVVKVDGSAPGYLVLTDIFYPGWTCSVDGRETALYRGDFLFRAVAVPAGAHRVVFAFAPASYRWGKRVSVLAALAVLGLTLLAWGIRLRRLLPASSPSASDLLRSEAR